MVSESDNFHNNNVFHLDVPTTGRLDRKKSLSTSALPVQNQRFLCVPQVHRVNGLDREISVSTSTISKITCYNSITKVASVSQSSLTIPDNYSFASVQIHVYKRRWALLVLCILYTAISYMQWIQYSIVANIMQRYYNVTSETIDWTSLIFMVVYILFVFPVSYFMDVRNMRQTAVLGAVGTAIGSWIKVFSVNSNHFHVVLLGQGVVALSQVFVISMPARLASSWFSPDQASSICAFGVFGSQLGLACGFLFTPMIIRNHENLEEVGTDLKIFLMIIAGISTFVAIIVIASFKSSPEHAPSHMQAIQRTIKASRKGYWSSVSHLIENKNYMILVLAYGINVGVFSAFSTLLNQIVLHYFPNSEQDAGNIGLTTIALGLVGSVVFGYILDTTHKFKETAVWVCRLTSITLVVFSLALESGSKKLLYVASIFLGFFITGFQPIGYEFAAELTFPEPDGPVTGILNISTQICGIIITLVISEIQDIYGNLVGNLAFAALMMFVTEILQLIQPELRRHNTHLEIDHEAQKEIAKEAQLYFIEEEKEEYDEHCPLQFKIDDCS